MNAINEYSETLVNFLLPELQKYIGKRIFLVNGTKAKIFELPELERSDVKEADKYIGYSYYINEQYNKVCLHVRVRINGGSYDVRPSTAYCQYNDRTIELGDTENGILKTVDTLEKIVTSWELSKRYSEETIQAQIARFKEAKKAAEALLSVIPYEVIEIERLRQR